MVTALRGQPADRLRPTCHRREGRRTARPARSALAHSIPCRTLDDALPYVAQAVLPGDIVLVKGSRVMGMERLIEAMKQYPQRKSA